MLIFYNIVSHVFNPYFDANAGTNSLPVLDGETVNSIIANAAARGPLMQDEINAVPKQLNVAIDPDPMVGGNGRKTSVYNVGNISLRANPEKATNKLLVRPDGTPLLPTESAVTLESAIFPYLFPDGQGAFQHIKDNKETLASYLAWRMKSMFTAFTLFKPYLLIMYQVRQVCCLFLNGTLR